MKGAGSFVTEMADAVLNGLTNSRHSKFMAKFREFEEKERKLREVPATTSPESASLSRNNSRDEAEKLPTSAKEGEESTSIKVKDETSNLGEGTDPSLIMTFSAIPRVPTIERFHYIEVIVMPGACLNRHWP